MAVVQISRIQIRRGQKNVGSGIPQLAGGELGWAVDSQELYIGNGAVSEGSPAVGNSKIITEHDNLFELASTYTYKTGSSIQTGASATSPITRTLQKRLDETVTVQSFGALGDGTDQTEQLQRAVDQLYLNTSTKGTVPSRVVLELQPGTYTITNTIHIPPHATLIGAGSDKTIIHQTGEFPIFKTVNSLSTPGTPAPDSGSSLANQARKITIKGITLKINTLMKTGLDLVTCRESLFEDINIEGPWVSTSATVEDAIGIKMSSLSSIVGTMQNTFRNVKVTGFSYAIKSDDDCNDNLFDKCTFETNDFGIVYGKDTIIGSQAQATGPSRNNVSNSLFRYLNQHGLWYQNGQFNHSTGNKFIDVGNEGGGDTTPFFTIINTRQEGNSSSEDFFERKRRLMYDANYTSVAYKSETEGEIDLFDSSTHNLNIIQTGSYVTLFRLPGDASRSFSIEYTYKSSVIDAQRMGVINLVIDSVNNAVSLDDEFTYSGSASNQTNLQFRANYLDVNGDTTVDTVAIQVLNSTTSDLGYLHFKVNSKT